MIKLKLKFYDFKSTCMALNLETRLLMISIILLLILFILGIIIIVK